MHPMMLLFVIKKSYKNNDLNISFKILIYLHMIMRNSWLFTFLVLHDGVRAQTQLQIQICMVLF